MKHEIVICMGSSCFARGNNRNLTQIREFVRARGIEARVQLTGLLCHNRCNRGPNIVIDGVAYDEVSPSAVIGLIEQHLQQGGKP